MTQPNQQDEHGEWYDRRFRKLIERVDSGKMSKATAVAWDAYLKAQVKAWRLHDQCCKASREDLEKWKQDNGE